MPACLIFKDNFTRLSHVEVNHFIFIVLDVLSKDFISLKDVDWIVNLKRLWVDSAENDPNNIRNLYFNELLTDAARIDVVLKLIDCASQRMSKFIGLVPKDYINSMISTSYWHVSKDIPKEYFLIILFKVKSLLLGEPFVDEDQD